MGGYVSFCLGVPPGKCRHCRSRDAVFKATGCSCPPQLCRVCLIRYVWTWGKPSCIFCGLHVWAWIKSASVPPLIFKNGLCLNCHANKATHYSIGCDCRHPKHATVCANCAYLEECPDCYDQVNTSRDSWRHVRDYIAPGVYRM